MSSSLTFCLTSSPSRARTPFQLVILSLDAFRYVTQKACVAALFFPETKFATFELVQRESAKAVKDNKFGVSGPHTSDAEYDVNSVITSKENKAAWGEMFRGLKSDAEYDPTNGYRPLKPVT